MHFLCIFLLSLDIVLCISFFFFFNDTATTEIYTLSLHDALPIFGTSTNRHGTETHLPRKLHSKVTKPSNSLDRNGIAGTPGVSQCVESRDACTHQRRSIS